ncbi:MAG TPA: tRNA pseudouridine(55) synthase TruB [Verrucomicrobiae bacterium]|nr:tRNA pseudouridine(55) synthase TruB [Verrucomicrobiae bacterium]
MQPQLSPFDGVLLIDKPAGMTSHDVVDRVRRHFGFKKVGHCGTLDPAATGLLILVLERATKLQDRLMSDDKAYEGAMILGVSTDSQDADGEVIAEKPVPPLTAKDIEEVLAKFRGDIQQIPPMVSAVKHQGTPLYKLARKGKTVERKPRLIHIYDLRVLGLELPRITFRVACTKGTYVRTICSDVGDLLGCGAHLHELRRTRSGKFDVNEAHQLQTVLTLTREELKSLIIPILKFVGSSAA